MKSKISNVKSKSSIFLYLILNFRFTFEIMKIDSTTYILNWIIGKVSLILKLSEARARIMLIDTSMEIKMESIINSNKSSV
jgi:hypothetical protein